VFDLTFDIDDLALDEVTVSTMRDSVALPESGASQVGSSCSCGSSSCCCCTTQPTQPPGL
jgi:hypothetical protein